MHTVVNTTCLVHSTLIRTKDSVFTHNAGTDTHAYTVLVATQWCGTIPSSMAVMGGKGVIPVANKIG